MPALSVLLLVALSQAKPHPKVSAPMRTGCFLAGQFYNLGDKKKTPWVGLRVCRVSAHDHDKLVVQTEKGKKTFAVPFSTSSSSGTGWQRMAKEKSGCDLVLIKTAGGSSCKWQLLSGSGSVINSGQVTFKPKKLQPFSMPSSRVRERHVAPKGLKKPAPPKKKPKG